MQVTSIFILIRYFLWYHFCFFWTYQFLYNNVLIVLVYWYFTGQDYESGTYTVEFPAGKTTMQFNVSIINDDMYEVNETFELAINQFLLSLDVSATNPDQARVIIINDDSKWYWKYKYR